jgi:hypothetical protein
VASFALIVFLATAASDQLHAIGDNLWTGVSNQKVNVVAGHYVSSTDRPTTLFALGLRSEEALRSNQSD